MQKTGGCLCGALRYRADVADTFAACFCKMCQRWSAGAYFGVMTEGFEVTRGAEYLKEIQSSDWARRGFCSACGSNLYYLLPERGGHSLAIGTLDDTGGLTLARQFFADKTPADLKVLPEGVQMSEADCMAAFGGRQ